METLNGQFILRHAIRFALIWALIRICITLLAYFVDPAMMTSYWLSGLFFVVALIIPIWSVKELRKVNQGFLSFGQAFQGSFHTCFFASVIVLIFSYILFNFIDPSLPELIKNKAIENTEAMMIKFGTPQEEIDKQIEKLEEAGYAPTLKSSTLGLLGFALMYAIYSLILGATLQKKKPETGF